MGSESEVNELVGDNSDLHYVTLLCYDTDHATDYVMVLFYYVATILLHFR